MFRAFLKLGLTSFGGPIAHLGYFREEVVVRRGWTDDARYADLVALCQFLPGPASSKVGFALGLMRAGPLGAVAAWCAFTLPSAAMLVAFAYGSAALSGPWEAAIVHGLKLVAVAIVAQAVLGMARTLLPDRVTAGIAVCAAAAVWVAGSSVGQVGAIVLGGAAGIALCRGGAKPITRSDDFRVGRKVAIVCALLFLALLVGLPLLRAATGWQAVAMADAFYRSGALVFGGGHVILPLLRAEVVPPGWVDPETFLVGYSAAQAVPGPLFTFAAFLGAAMVPQPNGFAGAALALVAVFLPGMLILLASLPFWGSIRTTASAQAALRGANAAVVGILAAALYDPVSTSAIGNTLDLAAAAFGFAMLTVLKAPPWSVVVLVTAIGTALWLA